MQDKGASNLVKKTVMLVDDSSTLLRTVSEILHEAGFHVITETSAKLAMKKFAMDVLIDLLLTDLNMPGMDGIELTKKVREIKRYRFIPILFLTTEPGQERRMQAKQAGASGWLVKPLTGAEILEAIEHVLP